MQNGGTGCVNRLFAETLRKLRTERGISQSQLGKQLFVNHSTVARWESG
ncbi:MAG: helix-turn-helix transcriptional regulator, partial [Clostridium sp.]|nr:helix-turn-helix transcriptional regulator [Clostridium sp.]